ncbi:MAG: SHOCT domain-containing protein [Thermoleophilia bacterium]
MLNPLTHGRILRKGLPGRATIHSMGAPGRGATWTNVPMTLTVLVEGMAPYEVQDQWWVKHDATLGFGMSLPVRVDRDDPTRVAIDWDAAREEREAEEQRRREALAALGPVGPDGTLPGSGDAGADVAAAVLGALGGLGDLGDVTTDGDGNVSISRVVIDATGDSPLREQILAQLGLDEDAVAALKGARGGAGGPTGDEPGDDPLDRLERLARLRDQGALTEAEFAEQKAKLLREL